MTNIFYIENPIGDALPSKHFALPPYKAAHGGGANGWWYVANAQGFNVLSFADHPGVKFTSEANARKIAEGWSK